MSRVKVWSSFLVLAVLLVAASFIVPSVAAADNTDLDCSTGSLSQEAVINPDGTATIINCTDQDVQIGIASYEIFSKWDHLEYFAHTFYTLPANGTLEISVDIPDCSFKLVVFRGWDVVTGVLSWDDIKAAYGDRLINWNNFGTELCAPPPPPPTGGEGCTPGYWRQDHHFDSWVMYTPDQLFSDVFGVAYDGTLLDAVWARGGQENALARHAVAALLNAASDDVSYEYTTAEVIGMVQDAFASGDYNGTKDMFEEQNETGCPLN